MRKLLLGAALLTSGFACDDPEVQSRAAEVLEHGMLRAQVNCVVSAINNTCAQNVLPFQANLFQDGSSLVTRPQVQFNERSVGVKTCFATPGADHCFEAVGGNLVATGADCDTRTIALDSVSCTGFNLEAFGVE